MPIQNTDIISKKDHGHTVICQNRNTIVEMHCADNFTYEVEHLLENLLYLKQIAGDKQLLVINYVAPYTQISTEARAFLANGSHKSFIKAEAYCIHSLAQKLLASFFVKIDKPKVPVKFFTKKEEAEKWLLSL
jgi:hypothetical protein